MKASSWADKAGSAIDDFGAALDSEGDVPSFSIPASGLAVALDELLAGHPHRHSPGAAIDAYEFLAPPGM